MKHSCCQLSLKGRALPAHTRLREHLWPGWASCLVSVKPLDVSIHFATPHKHHRTASIANSHHNDLGFLNFIYSLVFSAVLGITPCLMHPGEQLITGLRHGSGSEHRLLWQRAQVLSQLPHGALKITLNSGPRGPSVLLF